MPDNFDTIMAENAMLHMTVEALKGQIVKLSAAHGVLLGMLKLILLLQPNYTLRIPGLLIQRHLLQLDNYQLDATGGTEPHDIIYHLVIDPLDNTRKV